MKISISDLVLIPSGGDRRQAIINCVRLAQYADRIGYHRIWYAEHHISDIMMSSSPEILITLIAGMTTGIRVGSGGVLLNYYNPFKIAEMFSLISEIFPGRIDLGIGRASSGVNIDYALKRNSEQQSEDDFHLKLPELIGWLDKKQQNNDKLSNLFLPNADKPSVFLLGSSQKSAKLAGTLGLPYVFADFFNPDETQSALNSYFTEFNLEPGATNSPYAILSFRIITAKSEKLLRRSLSPLILMREQLKNGTFKELQSISNSLDTLGYLPPIEHSFSFDNKSPIISIGTPSEIQEMVLKKIGDFPVDEIMFQDFNLDHNARLGGYKSLAAIFIK